MCAFTHLGIIAFWRGVGASVTRVGPYFGIKFMSLERYKEALGRRKLLGVQLRVYFHALFFKYSLFCRALVAI